MKELALTVPGSKDFNPNVSGLRPEFKDLGSFLTALLPVIIYLAAFLMIFWMAWGVFEYIFAGGNKDSLSHARKRITWSIVGFLVVIISFSIYQYAQTIFTKNSGFANFNTLQTITDPTGKQP